MEPKIKEILMRELEHLLLSERLHERQLENHQNKVRSDIRKLDVVRAEYTIVQKYMLDNGIKQEYIDEFIEKIDTKKTFQSNLPEEAVQYIEPPEEQ